MIDRRIPFYVALGIVLGLMVYVLLAASPEIGTGPEDASWAPAGIKALRSTPGLLFLSGLALALLIIATRPRRRATPLTFFDASERQAIRAAIAAAETRTSGEIRVHLAPVTKSPDPQAPRTAAEAVFEAIGMTATAERNGVLLYISVADHRFAVVGDKAIDEKVANDFWVGITNQLAADFKRKRFAPGTVAAIGVIAEELGRHFPRTSTDVNELSDDISTDPC